MAGRLGCGVLNPKGRLPCNLILGKFGVFDSFVLLNLNIIYITKAENMCFEMWKAGKGMAKRPCWIKLLCYRSLAPFRKF